jgi:undecaprenyl-diphosphatase
VDWRVYHAINRFVSHHTWLGTLFKFIETYGTYAIGVAAVLLWLLARPGGDRKWKIAAASALGAAALGLVVNKIISSAWHRDRPFQTHHVAHIWGPRKTDASFPSDHSSAAFAIAVAVLLLDPLAGVLFLVLAALIAIGRVAVGEHYPGDVLAGALIGTAAAFVVIRLARPVIVYLVGLVERVTDPLLRPLWRTGRGVAP